MSRRSAALAFFGISALLFSMRYLSAALFGALAEPRYWPGNELMFPVWLGFGSLALGVIYLVWAEAEEFNARRKTRERAAKKPE